jgi:hypothetical protein
MSHALLPDDDLSRFVFRKSDINNQNNPPTMKSSVFSSKAPKGFSVYHITGLQWQEIWDLAREYVEKLRLLSEPNEPILGRFDVKVRFYEEAQLKITHAPEPHPRHYNIHGMPVSTDQEAGNKLNRRQKLLQNTSLFISCHNLTPP